MRANKLGKNPFKVNVCVQNPIKLKTKNPTGGVRFKIVTIEKIKRKLFSETKTFHPRSAEKYLDRFQVW